MEYYYLQKGDIIKKGDEVDDSNGWNDPANWVKATRCFGDPAPDPQYPAHRNYRRRIRWWHKTNSQKVKITMWQIN